MDDQSIFQTSLLMGRIERHQRTSLLLMSQQKSVESMQFTGYLKWNEKSNWYTFTSITLENKKEQIASHINLPKFKIDQLLKITIQDNHKAFIITGKPDSYQSKGIARGSVKVTSIARK